MRFAAILFDFDGVLLESEYAGNRHLAEYLTASGHPISPAEAMERFMGLAGQEFLDAIERWTGRPLGPDFQEAREIENQRVLRDGVDPVIGAAAFVGALPTTLPRAICSSSTTRWIRTHLDHLGLRDAFEPHIYSGREHVARGKPAPDIYLHAAERLGVAIGDCIIIEDSPVGATGAVASGARVIGLCAGRHCPPDHGATLRRIGVHEVAADFAEVARMIGLSPAS